VFPWKDLLKIYGLVLGASIIVVIIEVMMVLVLASPEFAPVAVCIGIGPLIAGAAILYAVLRTKPRDRLVYKYPEADPQGPYAYSMQQQPYPQPAPHQYPPQPGYYQYHQPYGYPQAYGHGYPQYPYQYQTQYHYVPPPQTTTLVEKLELPGLNLLIPIFLAAVIIGAVALYYNLCLLFIPAFIIAFSFPSLIWITFVYNRDVNEPEPGRAVLVALTWGMLSTIPAILIGLPFLGYAALAIVVIAPLSEEFVKPLGLGLVKKEIDNELDGLIYGVTCGMGFAMMENLFYEINPIFLGSAEASASWTFMALVRGLASTLGHAVGAGVIGYMYGRYIHGKSGFSSVMGAYGLGVLLHLGWNGMLTIIGDQTELIYVFIIGYPIMEFFILKYFLDLASAEDEAQFGAGIHRTSFDEKKSPAPVGPGAPPSRDVPIQSWQPQSPKDPKPYEPPKPRGTGYYEEIDEDELMI
jgi:RsiW-degrading membrane proteinase PrsW (M82 family)